MTGYFLLLWSIKGSPKQPPSLEAIMGRTHGRNLEFSRERVSPLKPKDELWKSYIGWPCMEHILVCESVCLDNACLLRFQTCHVVLWKSGGQEATGVWGRMRKYHDLYPMSWHVCHRNTTHLSVLGKRLLPKSYEKLRLISWMVI